MVIIYLDGAVEGVYNGKVVPRRGEEIEYKQARYRVQTVRHRTDNGNVTCDVEEIENGNTG